MTCDVELRNTSLKPVNLKYSCQNHKKITHQPIVEFSKQ